MKCDELTNYNVQGVRIPAEHGKGEFVKRADVDAAIAELKAENRKLKRALYKACANWADVVAFEKTEGIGYDNSVAERWRKMESKCIKKAEGYK